MRQLYFSCVMAGLLCLHPGTAAAIPDELPADIITGLVPFGTYALARYKKEDRKGESQYLRSLGTTLVVNSALRYALKNTEWSTRPNGSPYGFPSGHASFMTSSAAYLATRYGWRYGLPAYALTGYVSWVRVDTDHHRWRDVIAGAALSFSISHLFVTPQDAPQITPVIGPDSVGLRYQRNF